MAQRQFRTDDTSLWTDRYGNGSDGVYTPSTSTDAPIDSACTGTEDTTSLSATNASFATGQLIFIHRTQGGTVGSWEFNRIASYSAGTITTAYNLTNTYTTNAQVVVFKQYSTANINTEVTVIGKAWNGSTGGIYGFFCLGTTTLEGAISATGIGFRGGRYGDGGGNAFQGEGTGGAGVENNGAANGNGAGGGHDHSTGGAAGCGGGGGGHYATGTKGSGGASCPGGGTDGGDGGSSVGNAALTLINLGGGSGGGGRGDYDNQNGKSGVAGGGIVVIVSKIITVGSGSIQTSGLTGTDGYFSGAASGGGAGGSILFKGQTITLGSNISALQGNGGAQGGGGHWGGAGGAGSVGRIHVDYSTLLSGGTTPTLDSSTDPIFLDLPNAQSYSFLM
jgi:hypothetical protein